jgi:hypothetical protein
MGIEFKLTPYADGDIRIVARGWCSGLLCAESREMQDLGEELFPSCESVLGHMIVPAEELQQAYYREQITWAVASILLGSVDLASRIRH